MSNHWLLLQPTLYRLHLVTDAALCDARGIQAVVAEAVQGGVTCVQLREKTLNTRDFLVLAVALKKLLTPLNVPLIINDRVDIALASHADGVHVGQSDMPVAHVRRLMPQAIIGLSVSSLDDLRTGQLEAVDYFGVSPVFSTDTKPDAAPALGLDGLREIRRSTHYPLVAIGGINLDNARQVMAAGANGVAVVSALCAAPDPEQAARALRAEIDKG